jgi:hypothetical protein
MRSYGFHPAALIPYEHMFPRPTNSTLAQRALGALRLTRSFLLLEDDREVDWEVDQDERAPASHPHRTALRGRLSRRRPGQPPPGPHVCISPVRHEAAHPGRSHEHPARHLARADSGDVEDRARSVEPRRL